MPVHRLAVYVQQVTMVHIHTPNAFCVIPLSIEHETSKSIYVYETKTEEIVLFDGKSNNQMHLYAWGVKKKKERKKEEKKMKIIKIPKRF